MNIDRMWREARMKPVRVYWGLRQRPMWRRFIREVERVDPEAAGFLRGSRYWWDRDDDEWVVKAKSDAAFEALQKRIDALAIAGRRTDASSIRIDGRIPPGIFVHNFDED